MALYEIGGGILAGTILAFVMMWLTKFFKIKYEGQWIVMLSAFIILELGISKTLHLNELITGMAMGAVVVNFNPQHQKIFKIITRYTEDLILLVFFLLSGLHLNLASIPQAAPLIIIFVIMRIIGKFFGAKAGGYLAGAAPAIRKYTGGGLIPQAGIAIGLVLHIYDFPELHAISEILLTTIMGSTIINEIIGPLASHYALFKAGEIKTRVPVKHKIKMKWGDINHRLPHLNGRNHHHNSTQKRENK